MLRVAIAAIVGMLGPTLGTATAAAANCAGEAYAPCMSEADVAQIMATVCLAPAGSMAEYAAAAEAAGMTAFNETKSSILHVLAFRDDGSGHAVVLTGLSDETASCTISTGAPLDDGLSQRLSDVLDTAGFTTDGTIESWDGVTAWVHQGGDGVGVFTLKTPDPAFDGTVDVVIDREGIAFE